MTTFDAIDKVYAILQGNGLEVFKLVKPDGDETEYIVINSLPISGIILKRCVVNVNVHVKDIQISSSTSTANTSRLKILAAQFEALLLKNIATDAHIYLESQGTEQDDALKTHYINFRLMCNLISD